MPPLDLGEERLVAARLVVCFGFAGSFSTDGNGSTVGAGFASVAVGVTAVAAGSGVGVTAVAAGSGVGVGAGSGVGATAVAAGSGVGVGVVTTGAVLLRTEIMPGSIGAGCCEAEAPGGE